MQVNLNPNTTTNYNRQQNPNFKAVNQEWLEKINKNINLVQYDFTYELLDPTSKVKVVDFIDTLEEAKSHYFPRFQQSIQKAIDWAKKATILKKSA